MINQLITMLHWKQRSHLKYASGQRQTSYKLGRLLVLLIALILIHSLAMVYFENLAWADALWLSVTTVTTVGYGDMSPVTWQGRLATALCLYLFAISLLAQLAALFFEVRLKTREDKLKGNWIWDDMKNHLLIINTPDENTDTYLERLVGQIRATPKFEHLPLQILTQKYPNGLPHELTQHGIVHYHGAAQSTASLEAANLGEAKYIVILARDAGDSLSDSLSFDILSRIEELGSTAMIAVECIVDENRQRLIKAGADVVLRPIRAYPELLVRALANPGTEAVLENLFTHDESHLQRIDIHLQDIPWKDIITVFLNNDFGIPMAYIDASGVHSNPLASSLCSGSAIIAMIRAGQTVSPDDIRRALS
ncbi:MAG: hypothetical protein KBT88_11475 [Gammaproteobacteria bacterium]|nr:hypothetical protein [Gammaproteobacteria bacterium]MBQ0840396.1 hypothetical protein [Gammaproteobacteria bacterium]